MINKYIATAKIVDPSAVASRATSEGFTAHKGSIFVSIPEMGFEEPNLIYCRYGLSIPYLKIQKDWRVWVEPTIGEDQRFCFTGIVDCGGDITPADADQAIIQFAAQMIYAGTDGVIHLSSKTAAEAFVLGGKLKTWIDAYIDSRYNTHTHAVTGVTTGTGAATCGPPAVSATKPTDIYSTKIMGE